jgi:hypothetical protein
LEPKAVAEVAFPEWTSEGSTGGLIVSRLADKNPRGGAGRSRREYKYEKE